MVKWWDRKDLKDKFRNLEPDAFYGEPETAYAYERDFNGVMGSEALVFVASDEPKLYGGANVELGIALGNRKPCILLGRPRNSAMYWGAHRARSIEEVLVRLGEIAGALAPRPLLVRYRENVWDGREWWLCEEHAMVFSRPAPDIDDVDDEHREFFPIWRPPLCSVCGRETIPLSLQRQMHAHLITRRLYQRDNERVPKEDKNGSD